MIRTTKFILFWKSFINPKQTHNQKGIEDASMPLFIPQKTIKSFLISKNTAIIMPNIVFLE
jgi:hypothetical protein